jgi:hypothetical protein
MKKDKDISGVSKEDALRFAANKMGQDAFFMGSALKAFQQGEQQDETWLAAFLGIEIEQLTRLAMCRRPYSKDPAIFRREIISIANYFGISTLVLTNLLRRAEAYESQTEQGQNSKHPLMAARDREEDEQVAPTKEKDPLENG